MSEFDYNNTNNSLNTDNTGEGPKNNDAGGSFHEDASVNNPDNGMGTDTSAGIGSSSYRAADEETGKENSPVGSGLYHYAGDPYKEETNTAGQDGRNPRYQYHGQQNSSYDDGNQQYYSNIPDEPDKKKGAVGKKIAKIAGAALLFGVVAGVGFAGVSIARDRLIPAATQKVQTTTVQDNGSSGSSDAAAEDVSKVVDAVMPSVVSITSKTQVSNYFFGTQESEGAGSGFILAKTDDTLMIATNNHVVEGATALTVGFSDGTTVDASIVGTDSDADLAVISVNAKDLSDDTLSTIKIAVLGSSDDLKVGEPVIAIGNALGYGQSVTTGVVSAKDREVSFTDGTMTLLQTDAAINPGNSGGVLVNMNGEVVGINNAKLEDTSVEGMGYAIPISTAQTTLENLMNAGSIPEGEAAYLGILGRTIDSQYSEALGMPSGVYVSQVVEGSPAEKAGIEAGDIITGFEGNTVSTMDGLKDRISAQKAGTEVEISLQRANQNGTYEEQSVKVTLGKESDYEKNSEEATEESTTTEEESQQYGTDPYEYFYNGGGNGGRDYYSNPYDYFFN